MNGNHVTGNTYNPFYIFLARRECELFNSTSRENNDVTPLEGVTKFGANDWIEVSCT
jgi:hypothetical protein